jgi:hypothetical protein
VAGANSPVPAQNSQASDQKSRSCNSGGFFTSAVDWIERGDHFGSSSLEIGSPPAPSPALLLSGLSSARAVPAVPAATTAAAAAFFATFLTLDPALEMDRVLLLMTAGPRIWRAPIFFPAFAAVLLIFDLIAARFGDVLDLPRLAAFYIRSSSDRYLGDR